MIDTTFPSGLRIEHTLPNIFDPTKYKKPRVRVPTDVVYEMVHIWKRVSNLIENNALDVAGSCRKHNDPAGKALCGAYTRGCTTAPARQTMMRTAGEPRLAAQG